MMADNLSSSRVDASSLFIHYFNIVSKFITLGRLQGVMYVLVLCHLRYLSQAQVGDLDWAQLLTAAQLPWRHPASSVSSGLLTSSLA